MADRARLVGINHVALEVGDLEEALSFYGRIFEIELRGRVPGMAFVDIGDQFIALSEGALSRPTARATSVSWSTIGMPFAPRCQSASACSQAWHDRHNGRPTRATSPPAATG